jgi:hypothetical protein
MLLVGDKVTSPLLNSTGPVIDTPDVVIVLLEPYVVVPTNVRPPVLVHVRFVLGRVIDPRMIIPLVPARVIAPSNPLMVRSLH